MFLKSLILRGFKTFADSIEIEFSESARITAIVGPNGCGKSNLLDATRWALGEDNPRQLRVASLADIIFAGTSTRKSLSLAEVSLVFDNSSGKLPITFAEVSIKRRTFAEGESEFFINKNSCRLKDIKDLLLDTGLGEGTYSIITQGQVDSILSSKGDERRMVFEEAAGINKYKFRKVAAQKKLIAAEQNMLRISDLKIEVGEQLINLEEQAKTAQQYLEIQAQVKQIDLGLCKRLLQNALEKRALVSEKLEIIKKSAEEKQESEEKDQEELVGLREKHKNLEREIDGLSIKLEQEKDRLRDVELNRRFVESEMKREEKRLETLGEEKIRLKEKIEGLNKQLEQTQKGIDLSLVNSLAPIFMELFNQSQKLIEALSSMLVFFGGSALSLTFGSSKEKEEACKMKLEILTEEAEKHRIEEENAKFGLQAHRAEFENLKSHLEERSKESLLNEVHSKKQEKENLSQAITALEDRLRQEDRDERITLGEETSLEISLVKLESEIGSILEKVSLEYNLSQEDVLALPYENQNISKAKKEVEEGKAKLRMLEPVNLLAVEEFKKGKDRLSFIDAQLEDLNSAREHLQNLINELDLRAEQNFTKTMEEVSAIFSQTFSSLFEGGEAKISLSPHACALDAEIEISVRPRGRKWLPLPLLSGGERSLSAIAILFSLLKIRPSPFCFLDEVDAALDDANIGRFANMLKDFSSQSQIIVITHNKRTMAVADNIYGVTMEEPGVSKVLSMKLTEAVR